ncbi:X-Pro dipeptidyl-peptidase [Crossiella equi]|uniref:Xaa-Pro dipeptidyl-peptidase n=1 Tax=Crossiella equi TaxID=130796 RepID=A0ABS5A8G5_9PSEU|nr:Xaa-Pro dipeptidyl-peptidase [Crossiella equi]MBP2472867.1 X-Pro dipeptidyl-peptidase [Crossiella equi]
MRGVRVGAVLLAVATAVSGGGVALAAPGAPGGSGTRPVYDFGTAVREQVWVESTLDGDADGRKDRIAVAVTRPKESDGGLRVPTIMQASPYFGGLLDPPLYPPPPTGDPSRAAGATVSLVDAGTRSGRSAASPAQAPLPWAYDNYFVPRGYAFVTVDMAGTRGSEGCPVTGGAAEVESVRVVVDWLNGRAKAFTAAGAPVRASWSTGNVGMIGVSYEGTLPNAVAATGVPGLRTIVPIGAISSWYDHYRSNGLVISTGQFFDDADWLAKAVLTREDPERCAPVIEKLVEGQDRATGDYNDFWAARDYRTQARRVRASVFVVHGLNDWNVKSRQYEQWWEALGRQGVRRKMWLHQGGHLDPTSVRPEEWIRTLHRWFDQELHGLDTGIHRDPPVSVERTAGTWHDQPAWPDRKAREVTLRLGDGTLGGHGPTGPNAEATFTDNPLLSSTDLVGNETTPNPGRTVFLTPPLTAPVRLSGVPRISLRAKADKTDTNLAAFLVDYGKAPRVDYATGEGVRPTTPATYHCPDEGQVPNPGCVRRREYRLVDRPWEIITRGWLDAQNRHSLWTPTPVTPNTPSRYTWPLLPDDYTFEAGHRIGLVVAGSDKEHVNWDATRATVTVDLRTSYLTLPLTETPRFQPPNE